MGQNIDAISYSLIKKTLDATTARSRAIAHNLSNVNTKGFKATRVVFEDKLKAAMSNESFGLFTTNTRHIEDESGMNNLQYSVQKDNAASMKLDGNNVDIDNEMTNLSANTIMYNALTSLANNSISSRRMIINGK